MRRNGGFHAIFLFPGLALLLFGCANQQTIASPTYGEAEKSASETALPSTATAPPTKKIPPSITPSPTLIPTHSPTQTKTPTPEPTESPTSTPTITTTAASATFAPGIYSSGGCTDFHDTADPYSFWPWADFRWCVESIEIYKNGSLNLVMSWTLLRHSSGIISITKRGDADNPNMYLTDNLGNRYDAIAVGGEAAKDIVMELNVTYFGSFTFHPPKPGANRFTFHDDDQHNEIPNIILDKPVIYIYDINLKWTPLTISYFSHLWTKSETEDGGFILKHTKYTNCEIEESESDQPQGKYINTIEIGRLSYDIYRTQQTDFSLREYIPVSGIQNIELPMPPLFRVRIPYDNSRICLDDVGTVLSTLSGSTP